MHGGMLLPGGCGVPASAARRLPMNQSSLFSLPTAAPLHTDRRTGPAHIPNTAVAYLTNSFVVPLLAAYFAGSSNSW